LEAKRLGRYVIESELGKGGMGVVYRARDERLGKTVALKVLLEAKSLGADSRKRFRLEARAAAILNHPSIVGVYDYQDEDVEAPFIVYEYAQGRTLDHLIAEGSLDESRIIDIAIQVASGLEHAHERGILHRDIKPQNLILTDEGRVKILDFGLAKRTRVELERGDGTAPETTVTETVKGTIVGTAQYMSPEQLAGEVLDGRTDIFSLGVVLYEMATGQNPFQGQTFASIVGRIMSPEAPSFSGRPLRVSRELQDVILRCLQKRRDERYPGVRRLVRDLEALRDARAPRTVAHPQAVIPRGVARASLVLLQFMYLSMYGFALYYHLGVLGGVTDRLLSLRGLGKLLMYASPIAWTTVFLTTACAGIAVRLYLLVSVIFDDEETGRQFRKLFPFAFLLDELWALSPLLLLGRWPAGISLICMAVLAYLPMSQRTLFKSAYVWRRADSASYIR
jgi:predicted Ser/Thr protein kinase